MILVEQFCAEMKKLQEQSAKRVEKQFDAVFKELDDLIFAEREKLALEILLRYQKPLIVRMSFPICLEVQRIQNMLPI